MGLELDYDYGQTPLEEEELADLKLSTISTRSELDEFEQLNIEKAVYWTYRNSFSAAEVLREEFLRKLHMLMFGEVWKWAGKYRLSNKNIGVDKLHIPIEVKKLVDDATDWIDNKTYQADEIAIRFKHRLVSIHPFPNGNGRHARLVADILVHKVLGKAWFTWGSASLSRPGIVRKRYISSLQQADKGRLSELLKFARS